MFDHYPMDGASKGVDPYKPLELDKDFNEALSYLFELMQQWLMSTRECKYMHFIAADKLAGSGQKEAMDKLQRLAVNIRKRRCRIPLQ